MFLDEIYSYGLSNSSYAPFITKIYDEGIVNKILTHDDFQNYVSVVSEAGKFDYKSVYYNQTRDVHPPLFYFVLHTICSLFQGSFTKWSGLGINLFFAAWTLLLLYKCSNMVYEGEWKLSILNCEIYALSFAGLSTLLMVRMYMLMTFLTVLLIYLLVYQIHKPCWSFYPLVALTIFAGMMTQYFYVIYAFLVCAVYDIYLLCKKKWKRAGIFSISALVGVGSMLMVFPCWYEQCHSQTEVSLDTVADNASAGIVVYMNRIVRLIYMLAKNMPVLALFFMAGLIGIIVFIKKKGMNKLKISLDFILISIPAILAFVVVAVIAPYLDLRYTYNILPLFTVVAGYIYWKARSVFCEKTIYIYIGAILCSIGMWTIKEPYFVYREYAEINSIMENTGGQCIYITDNVNPPITSDVEHLLYFDNICVINDVRSGIAAKYMEGNTSDSVVVFIAAYPEAKDEKRLLQELSERYDYPDIRLVANKTFSNIYLMSAERQ